MLCDSGAREETDMRLRARMMLAFLLLAVLRWSR